MAKQKTEKEETRKVIPYYPELRSLIPSLGFKSSTDVFYFLKQSKINFEYDRIATANDQIEKNIEVFNTIENSEELIGSNMGFIFVMDIPNTADCYMNVEVIHCFSITKDELIRYLKLKVFS